MANATLRNKGSRRVAAPPRTDMLTNTYKNQTVNTHECNCSHWRGDRWWGWRDGLVLSERVDRHINICFQSPRPIEPLWCKLESWSITNRHHFRRWLTSWSTCALRHASWQTFTLYERCNVQDLLDLVKRVPSAHQRSVLLCWWIQVAQLLSYIFKWNMQLHLSLPVQQH